MSLIETDSGIITKLHRSDFQSFLLRAAHEAFGKVRVRALFWWAGLGTTDEFRLGLPPSLILLALLLTDSLFNIWFRLRFNQLAFPAVFKLRNLPFSRAVPEGLCS